MNQAATAPSHNSISGAPAALDAVVVGAGFAGLYAIHRLRNDLGLALLAFEAGGGVGGTWYWNRYPGARCDIESHHYSYSFSAALQQEWCWSERFAAQPEILAYLNHVADRFDLRRSLRLNTRVLGAAFDEAIGMWDVHTDDGRTTRARYLVSAAGSLSAAKRPEYPGSDAFKGSVYFTAAWPQRAVDFTGQRVAVIGTGASGIQVIPEIARQAAHLTVFQRTPNYATPIRNRPMDPELDRQVKENYADLRRRAREAFIGVPTESVQPSAVAVSAEERQAVYEACYAEGGFRLVFGSFADLLFDRAANDTAAQFVRQTIRQRISDPAVAELLTPRDHPYGTKRPPLETDYYETYNRPNVSLVDLRATPIEAFTARGVRTREREYALDAIVLATGFDALTGPLMRMGVRGRGGLPLAQKWADGAHTYLGLAVHGFPNLFVITGPQSPSVLYNMPLAIEDHVDWIAQCISDLRTQGYDCIEPTAQAETRWGEHTAEVAAATLLPQADSWYMGANVPGKPRGCLVYLGGAPRYRQICADVAARAYEGFIRTQHGAPD